MHCRVCGVEARKVNDFGQMPIANSFIRLIQEDVFRFQLSTSFCEDCALFQIDEQPNAELMFHDAYPFFTGLSMEMTRHFKDLVQSHAESLNREIDPFVVEIGSNDGTLLQFVRELGIRHLGIDPSSNVVAIANSKGISSEVGFFGEKTAVEIEKRFGEADLILAANVICHIPDIIDLAAGVKKLLGPNGQFVFEEPYVGDIIAKTSYDQIYDEHVYLFGATSVRNIFRRVGLELIDAIPQFTHGGSMRYVIMHVGARSQSLRLNRILRDEEVAGLSQTNTYLEFAARCELRRSELRSLLQQLKTAGARVAGYAATSKSTTILNYCGINSDLIEYIVDSTPEKQMRLTPGSHIRITDVEELRKVPPDYLVLFAWNHEKEILQKEIEITQMGVKWIRFVPNVEIIS